MMQAKGAVEVGGGSALTEEQRAWNEQIAAKKRKPQ